MNIQRNYGILLAIAVLAACERPAQDRSPAVVVKQLPPSHTLSVDTVAQFTLGDGDLTFGRVASLVMMDSSTLVIGDGLSHAVLLFDIKHHTSRVLGKEGDGPGEFRDVCCMFQWDDSTFATYDSRKRRLILTTLTGAHIGEGQLLQGDAAVNLLVPLGRVALDSIMVRVARIPGTGVGTRGSTLRDTVTYENYSAHLTKQSLTLEEGRHVATGLGPTMYVMKEGGYRAFNVPYGPAGTDAFSRGYLAISEGATRAYEVVGPDGRIYRGNDSTQGVEMTPAAYQRIMTGVIESNGTGPNGGPEQVVRAFWERTLAEMPRSKMLPATDHIMIDDWGNIWLHQWDKYRRGVPQRWFTYSSTGASLGDQLLPSGFEPIVASRGYLVGVFTDDDGIQTVRGYRVLSK